MPQKPPSALRPELYSHARPKLIAHPYAEAVAAVRKPNHLDRTTHELNNLPAKAIHLGGYAPLGSGTWKQKNTRQ